MYQSSTYVLPTPELGAEIAASWHPQRFYTRYGSPNVAQVEALMADLEGAEGAIAVTANGGTVTLGATGQGTSIAAAGAAPGPMTNWPADKLARALATVTFR